MGLAARCQAGDGLGQLVEVQQGGQAVAVSSGTEMAGQAQGVDQRAGADGRAALEIANRIGCCRVLHSAPYLIGKTAHTAPATWHRLAGKDEQSRTDNVARSPPPGRNWVSASPHLATTDHAHLDRRQHPPAGNRHVWPGLMRRWSQQNWHG